MYPGVDHVVVVVTETRQIIQKNSGQNRDKSVVIISCMRIGIDGQGRLSWKKPRSIARGARIKRAKASKVQNILINI